MFLCVSLHAVVVFVGFGFGYFFFQQAALAFFQLFFFLWKDVAFQGIRLHSEAKPLGSLTACIKLSLYSIPELH